MPSLYEGFSLPAAEAMATGTALLATTGGAVPEVAGPDGETCLAVPPGDADALAAGLNRLLGDRDLRPARRRRTRTRAAALHLGARQRARRPLPRGHRPRRPHDHAEDRARDPDHQ
ncbi:glycosyltransferase family 4 protein [Streptomyces violaceorubidus]